ncbi:MAG: phospholipase C, phosphocholine-specific [Bacteroidota bacterium]
MDTRREFIRKSMLLSGAAGLSSFIPASIQKAFAIDPRPGSTFMDAEHIVILMQENRSFDHCFGTLQGVRGFNDPRAITLPDQKPVWLQTNETGETYSPFRLNIKDTKITWMGDLPHSRASQVDAYNNGKYDKWLTAKRSGNKKYADMPLTMGYYNRNDLPFNYGMADAFTVCDQNFCSGMTSTTPNRSFFWTGKITHTENDLPKANIRNDDYQYGKMPWKTFPELLGENNVPWKFYQNELDCGGGFKEEERAWLSNFGCNLLEFFTAYNVKFTPWYIKSLQQQVDELPGEISQLQQTKPANDEAAQKMQKAIAKKQEVLNNAIAELKKWNKEAFEQLPEKEKNLYRSAFVVNDGDPSYRSVTQLKYNDGTVKRELTVPDGDILYQFRKDVNEGKLPTVSWLAGPQNFSDHPSAPWYGAWYVSEVVDILTKNPEVWKKTIFILTYDENDGYYDHVPPFSIPDNNKPGTGKCSTGIDTEIEHVRLENELKQGISAKQAREGAVGLGFRVPMIIASPWSRGGKVCSQLFDHTSTLQFLETFLSKKFSKNIRLDNISAWRRTICGDLTAAFSPFDGSPIPKIPFLDRDPFAEDIYNAQFRKEPSGYKKLTGQQVEAIKKGNTRIEAEQEKGIRPSCAVAYELMADSSINTAKKQVELKMTAGNNLFGDKAAGSPFTVYAPGQFKDENGSAGISRAWSFAVAAGDSITYGWPLDSFENSQYHLRLYGPNGFYREFKGSDGDPALNFIIEYETDGNKKATGNISIQIGNNDLANDHTIEIKDNAYNNTTIRRQLASAGTADILLPLSKSQGWYDFTISIDGGKKFEKRYAGRVETGKESVTDPFMGKVI